jgi:tRNA pseudouridine(55) synthase
MQEKIKIVYKKCGQTPLDCIKELKNNNPGLLHLPLTYAGRLDPLAEGVLILLIGDECLKKDEYLKLTKEYETTILFGFETDTYDLMGRVVSVSTTSELLFKRSSDEGNGNQCQTILNSSSDSVFNSEVFKNILPQFTGRIKQSYPPYSSRTVNGKPLYKWAREGKLDEITIPTHDVHVESIEIIEESFISGENFMNKIIKDISLVNGDFRQSEIIDLWKETLKDKIEEQYKTITLKISCGSGVYVRGIAHELGISLGVPALALNIKRTKVGEYEIN